MKYIKKGEEPESLKKWKQKQVDKTPTWKSFKRTKVKDDLLNVLLKEQGYICCYCGASIISDKNRHIEHFIPQSVDEKLKFEYTNLIVSCQAEYEDKPRVPRHCGHIRDNWYNEQLMVSPLEINCRDFFKYSASGEILATDELDKKDAAKTTIEKLALNISKLQNMRKSAIEGVLLNLDIDELTELEIQQLAQGYEQLDANGQYTPFCAAIAYLLQTYFCYSK